VNHSGVGGPARRNIEGMGSMENRWEWLDRELREQQGQVSCFLKGLRSGESYSFQADAVHSSASVIKIFLMACLFQRAEEGALRMDQEIPVRRDLIAPSAGVLSYLRDVERMSLRDLTELMIIVSDNSATNLLLDQVGFEGINTYLERDLGLKATRMRRKMMDLDALARGEDNTTSAAETAEVLEKIWRGELVSPEASREMLRILKNQQDGSLIPWYLDDLLEEHTIAHKTGGLTGVVHDAAVVDGGREPFILCFFGSRVNVPSYGRLMQDASLRIFRHFQEKR